MPAHHPGGDLPPYPGDDYRFYNDNFDEGAEEDALQDSGFETITSPSDLSSPTSQ